MSESRATGREFADETVESLVVRIMLNGPAQYVCALVTEPLPVREEVLCGVLIEENETSQIGVFRACQDRFVECLRQWVRRDEIEMLIADYCRCS